MNIQIDDQEKMVTIWLSHQDREDLGSQETIKRICEKYERKKYLVGVFLSGQEDLLEQTSRLLCHNQQTMTM